MVTQLLKMFLPQLQIGDAKTTEQQLQTDNATATMQPRERQTERQRQTDRQTDRDRDRETETVRQRKRDRVTERDGG